MAGQGDSPAARQRTILVCAFGPFPGVAVNPSAALARALARFRRPALADVALHLLILPTRWDSLTLLDDTLARLKPDAVLLLGVAARRKVVCVEARALNKTRPLPDAAQRHPSAPILIGSAPEALGATAALPPLLAALRAFAVPARPSRDAGRYLCNASYFHALLDASHRRAAGAGALPVVFIHLPGRAGRPAGVGAAAMVRALSVVLVALKAADRTATTR